MVRSDASQRLGLNLSVGWGLSVWNLDVLSMRGFPSDSPASSHNPKASR